jgi:hypothetical protein
VFALLKSSRLDQSLVALFRPDERSVPQASRAPWYEAFITLRSRDDQFDIRGGDARQGLRRHALSSLDT